MATARLFLNNLSQAVRLPKEVAFPDFVKAVEVVVDGDKRILVPVQLTWESWFDSMTPVAEDFLADRAQGVAEERDQL
ncbi:MAG: antitoxin [Propionibacteriaceae bacterium]|jgi:antitoxin VapB|nr:antitoxin [Propionibacteriaceae bacterium]